jgi:hypothetical protein
MTYCGCWAAKGRFFARKSLLAANVYQPRRNVYPQDELSPQHKVELRGVKEVIRSFRALTKFTPILQHKKVEREKASSPRTSTNRMSFAATTKSSFAALKKSSFPRVKEAITALLAVLPAVAQWGCRAEKSRGHHVVFPGTLSRKY